jgi:hypothetical protein
MNTIKSTESTKRTARQLPALMVAVFAVLTVMSPTRAAQAEPVVDIDAAAPVISRHDIEIEAPLDTVWKIQTSISEWTQWRPTVTAAQFDGELKTGAAFKWEEGGLKITSTVQQLLPGRRIVWTGPAQGIFAVHVWEFTATERGVHVHTEESWSGDRVQAQAAALQPVLDGALIDWLERLKSTSEAAVAMATP